MYYYYYRVHSHYIFIPQHVYMMKMVMMMGMMIMLMMTCIPCILRIQTLIKNTLTLYVCIYCINMILFTSTKLTIYLCAPWRLMMMTKCVSFHAILAIEYKLARFPGNAVLYEFINYVLYVSDQTDVHVLRYVRTCIGTWLFSLLGNAPVFYSLRYRSMPSHSSLFVNLAYCN